MRPDALAARIGATLYRCGVPVYFSYPELRVWSLIESKEPTKMGELVSRLGGFGIVRDALRGLREKGFELKYLRRYELSPAVQLLECPEFVIPGQGCPNQS